MIRKLPLTTLATALAACVALSACNNANDDADTAAAANDAGTPAATEPSDTMMPPATTDTDAATGVADGTANAAMTITSVDLGSAVGEDNRISVPTTTFTGTDTIHASVVTDGSSEGTLVATWTYEDGQVVDTQEKVVPAGPQVTDFSITKPDGWPAGEYKLQISRNGMVLQTREFSVG